jgi:hypothetical protein
MRYRLRDPPAMFRTPAGRVQLQEGIQYRLVARDVAAGMALSADRVLEWP